MPDEKKLLDPTLEWAFCTAHGTSTVTGSCDACNGDRCLIQVVPKAALEAERTTTREAVIAAQRHDVVEWLTNHPDDVTRQLSDDNGEYEKQVESIRAILAENNVQLAEVRTMVANGEVVVKGAYRSIERLTAELAAAKEEAWANEQQAVFMKSALGCLPSDDAKVAIGRMAAIADARDAAKAADHCDACSGTGTPISGKPCMCQGSGRMSDAARWLREELVKADTKIAAAKAEASQAHEEVGMLATAVLAAWQNKDVQELARIIVIAKDGWPSVSLAIGAPAQFFRCPSCGDHVKVDEDGCCATCGEDCTVVDASLHGVDPRESMVPLEGEEPKPCGPWAEGLDGALQELEAEGRIRFEDEEPQAYLDEARHSCHSASPDDCLARHAPPKVEGPPAEVKSCGYLCEHGYSPGCPRCASPAKVEPYSPDELAHLLDPARWLATLDGYASRWVPASTLSRALDALDGITEALGDGTTWLDEYRAARAVLAELRPKKGGGSVGP